MCRVLKNIIETEKPKIPTLDKELKEEYLRGLVTLAVVTSDDFLDLPRINKDRFEKDGLFFDVAYYDDATLWKNGEVVLIGVARIKNRGIDYPLSIMLRYFDENNFKITVNRQIERYVSKIFVEKSNGEYFSEMSDCYNTIKLSELLEKVV